MDDPNSKSLRERLDALLRRAREISAEIERRVEEVTSEPPEGDQAETQPAETGAPDAEAGEARRGPSPANLETAEKALAVAAEAVAVTAEAAAVTAEALSTIASENAGGVPPEIPPAPPDAPTTIVPEAAVAVAADAKDAIRKDEKAPKEVPGPTPPPGAAAPRGPETPDENEG
jgi:hypothetical protein